MAERKVTEKELRMLARFERFLEVQSGAYPATIAAMRLKMTTAGVYQAGERGWLGFFQIGRDRWYSRRDVIRYQEHRTQKKNWYYMRFSEPKDWTGEEDGGASKSWAFHPY